MDKGKTFCDLRNMKGMGQRKISIWATNNRMTNVFNVHTYAIGRIDLVVSIVHVPHNKFLKISYHMICCTRVGIPIGVNSIRLCSVCQLLLTHVCWVKALVALEDRMIGLDT
jgi:hypothetical protein